MKKKLTATGKFRPKNVLSKSELKQILGGSGSQTCTGKTTTGTVTDDPFSKPC